MYWLYHCSHKEGILKFHTSSLNFLLDCSDNLENRSRDLVRPLCCYRVNSHAEQVRNDSCEHATSRDRFSPDHSKAIGSNYSDLSGQSSVWQIHSEKRLDCTHHVSEHPIVWSGRGGNLMSVSWVCFRATWVAVISCWKTTGRRLWKRGWTARCLDHTLSTSTSCRVPTSPSTNSLSMLSSRHLRELQAQM